nr:hypothetical protein [uncultured Pseudoxanthomonas sp.]
MLQTLAIHGSREKGKVGTGTFFTTIVKFGEPMPRRRVPTRISDADARLVAGHLMFAAAAATLGGVYGTVVLERALRFTPAARAKQQAERRTAKAALVPPPAKSKASLPTGTCKKWLESHVPCEQTLALIAESHPNVADRMKQARDGDLVRALTVAKDDVPFVGRRIASLSPELFGEYLGCMALGHCNPDFASGLAAGLLHLAMAKAKAGPEVLAAVIATDRQLPSPRGLAAARSLDQAFRLALQHGVEADPELAFAQEAIVEVWSRRASAQDGIEARPMRSQMFVTKPSKLTKFATN